MRIEELLPRWMRHDLLILGFEGEGEGEGEGDGSSGDAGDGSSGASGEGENDDADDDDADDADAPKDLDGLKSALAKERKNAKAGKAEKKRADALQARIDELEAKDQTEIEKATKAREKAEAKAAKLANGYKRSAVDRAIEKVARDLKFKDTDDAISLVDRSAITVEQDDDDPSEVTVDAKTVKQAVKALADRKKHLIGEEGSDDPSGSKFGGGGGKKTSKEATEDQLRNKYPALY
jgi:hypothetical protein